MSAVYAEAVECGLAPTHIWSTVSDPMILHRECLVSTLGTGRKTPY